MAKIIVEKSGPLHGEVVISGAKNAVLPIMAATLLSEETCEIKSVPALKDVEIMCRIIEALGAKVEPDLANNCVNITARGVETTEAPQELVTKMRASILAMGPLLARFGSATIHLPGGCAIGERPTELHIKGLRALGATVEVDTVNDVITARANRLYGNTIYLDFPSVGATENIIMAATLAEGTTIIENAAQEPEITDMANFLNKMGARIKGAGTDTVRIIGVESLHGARHNVIPDRIEAGTFMVAAAITHGAVLVKNVLPDHIKPIIAKLRECGAEVIPVDEGLVVQATDRRLTSTDIKTLPYPGFPTDMQAIFMALLTTVDGASAVIETVFENRYMHVPELKKMGASIKTDDRCALVTGNARLKGSKVQATDLRAGAAMVLAGLVADGRTEVTNIYHIQRGYEHFVEKMQGLGAKIHLEE